MQTHVFCAGDLNEAKVLVIGHDPRLQGTDTQATYAFFGDYFFRSVPTKRNELAKYQLAEAVFSYITHLTGYKYPAEQLILTNLCNKGLPHAPKGRTVYIPEVEVVVGIAAIQDIVAHSRVEIIFAMSTQVNYWLQRLAFYPPVPEFLEKAAPKPIGVNHKPPYYEPKGNGSFPIICGKRYVTENNVLVFPVLHVKNWPLRGSFLITYAKAYESCVNTLKPTTNSTSIT